MLFHTSSVLFVVPFLLSGITAQEIISARVGESAILKCDISDVEGGSWSFEQGANTGEILFLGTIDMGNKGRQFLDTMDGGYNLEIFGILPSDGGIYRCQYFDGTQMTDAATYDLSVEKHVNRGSYIFH